MRIKGNENGFTILELLASLVIISMIVLLLSSLVKIGMRSYEGGNSFTEMQENCRNGVEMMNMDIRKCRELVSVNNRSLVIRSLNGDEIRYYTNSHILYRSINGTANPAAMGITDFRIEEVFPDEIQIALQASDGARAYHLTTRVNKRCQVPVE